MANVRLKIENCRLIYRNFQGKPNDWNKKGGVRTFSVVLAPELAEQLAKDGWNVRTRPPREEGGEPLYHLSVKVNYHEDPTKKHFDPVIVLIHNNTKTMMNETTVSQLDIVQIRTADVVINGSDYSGKYPETRTNYLGVPVHMSAYVTGLFVTAQEDELSDLANKYDVNLYGQANVEDDGIPF